MRSLSSRLGVLAAIIGLSSVVVACSLLVSTSDLDSADGKATGPDAASSSGTASSSSSSGSTSSTSSSSSSSGDAQTIGPTGDAGDPHLIGAWSFDDGTGNTAIDATGHGHTAKLLNGATFSATGHVGGCVTLHGGTTESVSVGDLGDTAFPPTGTLSLWFRYSGTTVDTFSGVFDAYDETRNHLFVRHANGAPVDQFQFAAQTNMAGEYAYVEGFMLKPNQWTHLVMTWDAANKEAALIINSEQDDRDIYDSAYKDFVPSQQTFALGEYLNGDIDEVRLYDVALSRTQAEAIK